MANSSAGRRFMKLAGMTASIASKTLSHSIKNINADEEKKLASRSQLYSEIGIKIAETLGEMKGAVMKVGQIASQYKDIFPPEVQASIAKLQREAPSMPFSDIKNQIEKELGTLDWINETNKKSSKIRKTIKFDVTDNSKTEDAIKAHIE